MSSAMRPAPMTAAIKETKNRTNPFDAGTAKKLRSLAWPGMKSGAKNRRTIDVIVVKAAPIAVTTIAAGRRHSFLSPVAMMARTRSRRPRRGSSSRLHVRRAGQELAELTGGDLMAAVEDHHVLADRLDVREEVARQEHVAAGRLCDRPHEVEHLRPAARV